jgi:hypothetical protein
MTNIANIGYTKTIIKDQNGKMENDLQWKGNYDGKDAKINININNNGQKESIDLTLDNNDILEILNTPVIPLSLDKRLHNDFLKNKYLGGKRKTIIKKKNNKTKSYNKIYSRKKRTNK